MLANLITFLRLSFIGIVIALAYWAAPEWQTLNPLVLVVVFLMDALDGYVARKRNEATLFGSIFDIAADRVIEIVLWLIAADLELVPLWVAIVFIVRGNLVDSIRYSAVSRGEAPYDMMHRKIGRFLVASRTMRGSYNTLKMVAFAWLFAMSPWAALAPQTFEAASATIAVVTALLVYGAVAMCLLRGVPVIVEFLLDKRVYQRDVSFSGAG